MGVPTAVAVLAWAHQKVESQAQHVSGGVCRWGVGYFCLFISVIEKGDGDRVDPS